jgi:CheY-like chemotaxis protein
MTYKGRESPPERFRFRFFFFVIVVAVGQSETVSLPFSPPLSVCTPPRQTMSASKQSTSLQRAAWTGQSSSSSAVSYAFNSLIPITVKRRRGKSSNEEADMQRALQASMVDYAPKPALQASMVDYAPKPAPEKEQDYPPLLSKVASSPAMASASSHPLPMSSTARPSASATPASPTDVRTLVGMSAPTHGEREEDDIEPGSMSRAHVEVPHPTAAVPCQQLSVVESIVTCREPTHVVLLRQLPAALTMQHVGSLFCAFGQVHVHLVWSVAHGLTAMVTYQTRETAETATHAMQGRVYELQPTGQRWMVDCAYALAPVQILSPGTVTLRLLSAVV